MERLKQGDVVQLKSGGPNMTISADNGIDKEYECQWFADDLLQTGKFNRYVLELVKEDGEDA